MSQSNSTSKDKAEILIDCLNCPRSIASNRFAPHLSSCLGLGNGTRRGAARGTAGKAKLIAEGSRSNSPQIPAQDEGLQQPAPARKGRPPKNSTPKRPKSKADRTTPPTFTSPVSAQNQRLGSASPSPSIKGLPSSSSIHNNYPKIPSGLRSSSTTSAHGPQAPQVPSSSHAAGAEIEDAESTYSPSQSPTRSSSPGSGRHGSTVPIALLASGIPKTATKTISGKTAPPTYEAARPTVPITITRHNDPDYVGVDGDDLVDTESDDDGEHD
ncbi:hypothetical protein FRB96_004699 [Tulasnella sp. 330]|nr:hypothetical protein FRB96_004699 [Tulasnella sp. 330]